MRHGSEILELGTNTPNDVKFTVIVDNIVRGHLGIPSSTSPIHENTTNRIYWLGGNGLAYGRSFTK